MKMCVKRWAQKIDDGHTLVHGCSGLCAVHALCTGQPAARKIGAWRHTPVEESWGRKHCSLVEANPGSMGCPNEHKNTHSVSKELPVSKTFHRRNRHHSVSTLCHFLPHKPGVIAHAAVLVAWMLIPLNILTLHCINDGGFLVPPEGLPPCHH